MMVTITARQHHRISSISRISRITRLRVVETDLQTLKTLYAEVKEDQKALREDRDEWSWRAEYLLAERRPRENV
jgi:hypothetical protein